MTTVRQEVETDQQTRVIAPRDGKTTAESAPAGLPLDTDLARTLLSVPVTKSDHQGSVQTPGRSLLGAGADPRDDHDSGGLEGVQPRYNTNKVSQVSDQQVCESDSKDLTDDPDKIRQGRRGDRFALREVLWKITTLDRVRKCGRTTMTPDGRVAVVENAGVLHWSGYCLCGSIWACPVCSAKIRYRRADEISRAVAEHLRQGGSGWMITLTGRHKVTADFANLFDAVAKGWKSLMTGRAWAGDPKRGVLGEKDHLRVRGWIRSLEVTYGSRNGFHPHLHVVLLLDAVPVDESWEVSAGALAHAVLRWRKTWGKWMAKHGYEPTEEHGVTWSKVLDGEGAGQYVAKLQEGGGLGNELARGDMKKGRFGTLSMFEVLDYLRRTGDAAAVPIWQEYEAGTFGRKAITWSRGLRADLLQDDPEQSDEEVAEEEIGGQIWMMFSAEMQKAIRDHKLQSKILDVGENGGFLELVELLASYRIGYELPPE